MHLTCSFIGLFEGCCIISLLCRTPRKILKNVDKQRMYYYLCFLDITRTVEYDVRGSPLNNPGESYSFSLLECKHGLDVGTNQY